MMKRNPPVGNVRRVAPIDRNSRGNVMNKVGITVQFESREERKHLLRTDRDPHVLDYRSQPLRIFHDDSGKTYDEYDEKRTDLKQKMHTYVPDFKIWKDDGSIELHEITLSERRLQPGAQRREKAAREYCGKRGWRYMVFTEETLPTDTEAANLIELYMFRPRVYARSDIEAAVREKLVNGERLSLSLLIKDITHELQLPSGVVAPCLYHLLWHRKIHTDFSSLIFLDSIVLPQTLVWIPC